MNGWGVARGARGTNQRILEFHSYCLRNLNSFFFIYFLKKNCFLNWRRRGEAETMLRRRRWSIKIDEWVNAVQVDLPRSLLYLPVTAALRVYSLQPHDAPNIRNSLKLNVWMQFVMEFLKILITCTSHLSLAFIPFCCLCVCCCAGATC